MNIDQITPLCSGENCPLKNECARFRRDINKSKEDHFAWPPYNLETQTCGYFIQKDKDDPLIEKINKLLKDADKN